MPEAPKNKKSELRCERICEVALELFLERGYDATSISDIIAKSGDSLSSVYKYFDNKENLFLHIVEMQTICLDARLNECLRIKSNLELCEYLTKFGKAYLEFLFSGETGKFLKNILTSTSKTFSGALTQTPRILLQSSVLGYPEALREYLQSHISEFKSNQTAENLASYFCFLLREPYFNRLIFFGEEPKFDWETLTKNKIEIFLDGVKAKS